MSTPDIINSVGVSLVLLAFFLLTLKKVDAQNSYYNLLNFVGAGLACYGSYLIKAMPFALLEGIWSLVAFYGFVKKK
ncbi:MAG TPA: hypothetical protein VK835_13255 [Bacteroidia bacterium]|jgi:hypothetical protein|nr:hypothetical protein [Bacteroidia bacterium]